MVRISDRISYSIRYNYVIDHVEVKIGGNFVFYSCKICNHRLSDDFSALGGLSDSWPNRLFPK